ncbi:MAG: hypothetical protein KDB00_04135 [Planctomycetales bacterium]|nr:hypothetical protein [Planctomycetales bacterium]
MSNLFGLKVHAHCVTNGSFDPLAAVATYVDGSDFIRGQIACDHRCAAILGAALTQIPMSVVEDSIEKGELNGNLKANAHEVFNIAVNLFSYQQSSRVVLREVGFEQNARLPDSKRYPKYDDFCISVDRYGEGLLRMIHCV